MSTGHSLQAGLVTWEYRHFIDVTCVLCTTNVATFTQLLQENTLLGGIPEGEQRWRIVTFMIRSQLNTAQKSSRIEKKKICFLFVLPGHFLFWAL